MEESRTEINISKYWPFWGLNFGIHILLGLLVNIAGLMVIFFRGEIVSGLALVGAGIFSLLNGWSGFSELRKSNMHSRCITVKENSR